MREGEQPLDQRQPPIQLLRVLKVQPRRVVGDIGESERRIPVGTQRRIAGKAHPPRPPNHPDVEIEQALRIPVVNKIAKKAITVTTQNAIHRKNRMM